MAKSQEKQETQEQAKEPAEAGVNVEQAELPEGAEGAPAGPAGQVDILLDTPIAVSVRLGEANLPVRQLLQMGPGSVLKLDRQVGEPVDVFLRDIQFATGELVVADGRLGVRLTKIVSRHHEDDKQPAET